MKKRFLLKFLVIFLFCFIVSTPVYAGSIRDTEIENLLKAYSFPIFKAAGLDPYGVNIVIIDSPTVNAFVAGGNNIFLYTGLILETENPMELAAVIAHETGHITGGHLIRTQNNIKEAQMQSIVGLILGGVVAAGSGQASGGVATSQAAQSILERQLLSYSRIHENAADQAGFSFLEKAGISLKGSVSFLEKLRSQEGRSNSVSNEYTRTHPLTKDRVSAAEQKYQKSKDEGLSDLSQYAEAHERMKAKIFAYNYPDQTQFLYSGNRIVDHYARAMAAYRKNNLKNFRNEMAFLLEAEPDNPYFLELKGQVLFENGKVDEALPALEKAAMLESNAPLILTLYAHALIISSEPSNIEHAVTILKKASKQEAGNSFRNRLLSMAYGSLGKEEVAKLYQAEEALLSRDYELLDRLLKQLNGVFETGTLEWIKYQDLTQINDRIKVKRDAL